MMSTRHAATIGKVLDAHGGIGPGFDFLRIALALLILFTHSTDIVTGRYGEYADGFWQIPVRSLVPMFFALSGFLITGSAQRLRIWDFVLNRGMRIIPALAVDIVVAACIIGPIFTTLSLQEYLLSPIFWRYFTNITGVINYTLPGVFTHNVNPNVVNGSLWTVPFEIGCYVLMSLMIIFGLLNRRALLTFLSIGFCAAVLAAVALATRVYSFAPSFGSSGIVTVLANFTVNKAGFYLYFYFIAGSMAYLYRDRLPFRGSLMLASVAAFLLISLAGAFHSGFMLTKMIALLPILTYATVYIGMLDVPKIPFYHRGDYSYGVYLYGFPLQQGLMAAFPRSFNIATHYICSVLITTLFAMFSWHCIEKPILRQRRRFSFTARKTEEAEQRLPKSEGGSALERV